MPRMTINLDFQAERFKKGDLVTWKDKDNHLTKNCIERYGDGPFSVKRVRDVDEDSQRSVAATQSLDVCGVTAFSAWYFTKAKGGK